MGDPKVIDAAGILGSVGHRGLDGSGVSQDEMVGSIIWLRHGCPAILDPTPTAAQPMISVNGRFAINYDGEIYISSEIREDKPHE